MAAKRKHGEAEPVVEESIEFVTWGDQHRIDFAKPVYLVAEVSKAGREELDGVNYSIHKIGAATEDHKHRHYTVGGIRGVEPGMSFVAVNSKDGYWIVGVGGRQKGGTILFNPSTSEMLLGPRLLYPKHKPILISHGGEVYAISRRPRVVPHLDFEPWFQSLSFNNGVPSVDNVYACWSFLPPPPFFPCVLDPYEFSNPPKIKVSSYAVVGSHILLSPQQNLEVGTYGFHVEKKTWEKVCDQNLPFRGKATLLSSSFFAACPISKRDNSALVISMSVKVSKATPEAVESTAVLAIQMLSVVSADRMIPSPLSCPLEFGTTCFIRFEPKTSRTIVTTFQLRSIEKILTTSQSGDTPRRDEEKKGDLPTRNMQAVVSVEELDYMIPFDNFSGLVAALFLGTETIERKTTARARQATDSIIFEAPVIHKEIKVSSPHHTTEH